MQLTDFTVFFIEQTAQILSNNTETEHSTIAQSFLPEIKNMTLLYTAYIFLRIKLKKVTTQLFKNLEKLATINVIYLTEFQ